jgi:hypothetical protein
MRALFASALLVATLLGTLPLEARLRAASAPAPLPEDLGVSRLLGGALTGAFRPLLLDYLWLRAAALQRKDRVDELRALYRTMALLYPRNEAALEFIGVHLAFAMKSDVPDPRAGWRFAEEGLDLLARLQGGRTWIALWFLRQCGQDPGALLRCLGPEWEAERDLRARAEAWFERRFGERLDRFRAGLRALEGSEGFAARLLRARLLEALAAEQLAREGRSAHAEEAIRALRAAAAEVAEVSSLRDGFLADATVLEDLVAHRAPRALEGAGRDALAAFARAGAALFGMGVAARDDALLEAAAGLFERAGGELFLEERAAVAAWRAHLRDPSRPAPPRPFD